MTHEHTHILLPKLHSIRTSAPSSPENCGRPWLRTRTKILRRTADNCRARPNRCAGRSCPTRGLWLSCRPARRSCGTYRFWPTRNTRQTIYFLFWSLIRLDVYSCCVARVYVNTYKIIAVIAMEKSTPLHRGT